MTILMELLLIICTGFLKVKYNFSTKLRYFELDELNEYVSLYSVPKGIDLTADNLTSTNGTITNKLNLISTFSLEGKKLIFS